MTTADEVLAFSRTQLGECEHPMGSNCCKYNDWFGAGCVPWCAVFISWVYFHIDPSLIHNLKTYYSGDFITMGRKYGLEIFTPLPGCIAVMDYGDQGITDHVGLVESISGDYMTLIEGNHNDRVEKVVRRWQGKQSTQFWYIMPKYQSQPPPPPPPEEDKMFGYAISFDPMPKQGDLYIYVAADCWHDLGWATAKTYLCLKNENAGDIDVWGWTTPFSGDPTLAVHLPGRDDESSRVALDLVPMTPQGGFSVTLKSTGPVGASISIIGEKI